MSTTRSFFRIYLLLLCLLTLSNFCNAKPSYEKLSHRDLVKTDGGSTPFYPVVPIDSDLELRPSSQKNRGLESYFADQINNPGQYNSLFTTLISDYNRHPAYSPKPSQGYPGHHYTRADLDSLGIAAPDVESVSVVVKGQLNPKDPLSFPDPKDPQRPVNSKHRGTVFVVQLRGHPFKTSLIPGFIALVAIRRKDADYSHLPRLKGADGDVVFLERVTNCAHDMVTAFHIHHTAGIGVDRLRIIGFSDGFFAERPSSTVQSLTAAMSNLSIGGASGGSSVSSGAGRVPKDKVHRAIEKGLNWFKPFYTVETGKDW